MGITSSENTYLVKENASLSLMGLGGHYLLSEYLSRQGNASLSQVGLSGLEPPTSRLSGVRSNRLSYKPEIIQQPPALPCRLQHSTIGRLRLNHRVRDENGCVP